jgi:hypothetical protein
MPIARPRLTRPLPRPKRPGPLRRIQTARSGAAGGSSLPAQLGTWNFTVKVYLAFDGPNVALPNWLEVTEFVELESDLITIMRGRQDGLADVSVGTCGLTVDNTDGRWTPTNRLGAWFGQIKKGSWLRVDLIPPSGTVSRRFTGFINGLPTSWQGLYATAKITASDRFLLLGQAPMLPAMTSAEVVYDSSTGPLVAAHYPLSEALAGTGSALAFGDITGNISTPLHPVPFGSNYATYLNYIKAQGAAAPGFDGGQCVTFQPAALNVGTVLQTTVNPWSSYNGFNSYGVLELWLQTTFENTTQGFASLFDPLSGCAVAMGVDGATGCLIISTGDVTAGGAYSASNLVGPLAPGVNGTQASVVLNDGNWHYISVATGVGPTPTNPIFVINIDGKTSFVGLPANNVSPNMNTLIIGGSPTVGSYNCFTGNIANVSWILTGNAASNYPAHYAAGNQGFYGESVDYRIARVARYAGVPQPTTLKSPAAGYNPVPVYSGGYGPWTNLSPCTHQAGTQSIIGRKPLDVMYEAARTEQSPLYVDRYGYLAIQPCTIRYNAAVSWTVDAHDLDPQTQFPDDFTYVVNQVSVTPNGGASQLVNGAVGFASQAKYGVYNQSIQTASINPTEAANAALNEIVPNADPVPRIAPLVLEAATLATQPGQPVPAAIGVANDFGLPLYLVSSTTAYYGDQVYQTTVPAGSVQYTTILDLVMPATAGLQYAFQGRITIPSGAGVLTDIGMIFLDVNSVALGYGGGAGVTPTVGSTGWIEVSGQGTAPANTVAVEVKIEVAAPSGVPVTTTWQATALQFEQAGAPTTWKLPGAGSPNLLSVDQATAGQGTPYAAGGSYGPAWYDAVLATEISTVIGVAGLPPQAPAPSMSVFAEGYTETIGMGLHTFSFSSSPVPPISYFTLDDPVLGVLDSGNLIGY